MGLDASHARTPLLERVTAQRLHSRATIVGRGLVDAPGRGWWARRANKPSLNLPKAVRSPKQRSGGRRRSRVEEETPR